MEVPRLTALAVIVILACPPAVIGACAALLCAPEAGHGSHAPQVEAATSSAHHDHHAHHGSQIEHHAPAPASSSAFSTIPSPDCCTTVGARAIAAAVTSSSRLDSSVRHASSATFVPAVLHVDRVPALLRGTSPPERLSSPPQPVAAPLVLRI